MNYSELIAALPLPAPEQTAAFAEHVADNHSWYKHLPLFPPGATFVFFLNPHAGAEVVRDGDGFATRALEEGDYFRHHSRLNTAHYRARFGHWDYWVDNPLAYQRAEGPFIYGVGPAGREPLPDDLKRRWSRRLTAFLKPSPMLQSESAQRAREAFEEYARQNPTDPDIERYAELAREAPPDPSPWGSRGRSAFASSELFVQRQLVLQRVLMVRDDCARMRGSAE